MTYNSKIFEKPQIQIKRKFKHGKQTVWSAITNKDALSDWLMDTTDFAPIVGTSFRFTTKPQGGFDGIVNCKVIESDPPNVICYSWNASGFKEPTYVRWELNEVDTNETILTLSHTNFKGVNGWFTKQILNMGWKKLISKKLSNYLQQ